MQHLISRPRRLRKNTIIRNMVAETRLSKDMFIYPYFVMHGQNIKHAINAMPGIYHFSPDTLVKDVSEVLKLGVNKILLFGVGEEKDAEATSSYAMSNAVANAIRLLKAEFGNDIYIITDVCLCAYTDHGHCGVLHGHTITNDESIDILCKMALMHAEAGSDMVAPSDMMDGRVGAIRDHLDENKFTDTAIMSYSVKYASAYYGPFREAADSAPSFGDRKSYQMDTRNVIEGIKEAQIDEDEGADILMVKPALAYLDVISKVKQNTNLPLACYNVSGEYSMVKAAAQLNYIDEQKIVMENMYAFARAGADIIISYHARDIFEKKWM
ncbi:MAG: porphobilinogen synthase [Fimbriimonadaceae bacterium]|nr:porphobilinogen synthase [Chitinophagales bacterium]